MRLLSIGLRADLPRPGPVRSLASPLARLRNLVPLLALAAGACAGPYTSSGGAPAPQGQIAAPPSATQAAAPSEARIGIVLPQTGNMGEVGKALSNAAELALFDTNAADVDLLPHDAGASPSTAAGATQAALIDGAQVIIGPLGAGAVKASAAAAQVRGVRLLGFSTDRRAAGNGVYLLGFMPEEQVAAIIAYAGTAGLHRFGAIVPQDAYGNLVVQAIGPAVAKAGGTLVGVATYQPGAVQLTDQIRALVAPGPDGRPPVDGLIVPQGGNDLRQLLPALAVAGLTPDSVHLLGTDQWALSDLSHEPLAQGGWYAGPSPDGFENFVAHYQQTYGSRPPRIASQAYDAVTLAVAISRQPGGFADADRVLTSSDGFTGVDGLFRFHADGTAEHGLAVIEVTPSGPRILQAAPSSFGGAAF